MLCQKISLSLEELSMLDLKSLQVARSGQQIICLMIIRTVARWDQVLVMLPATHGRIRQQIVRHGILTESAQELLMQRD